MRRLELHLDLLQRWNPRINLVSRGSLANAWSRHFADSAQLWPLRPAGIGTWLDLGSGAGFPGLVIAALAMELAPGMRVALVESDARKAVFLQTVARESGLPVTVHGIRSEHLSPQHVDVVSARALGSLEELLAHAEIHRRPEGICLFPKGETVHKELAEAAARWHFTHRMHPSRTDPRAAIVEIGAFRRA
jgi:16S rRNA (guanine527-N7)-methyltransferase